MKRPACTDSNSSTREARSLRLRGPIHRNKTASCFTPHAASVAVTARGFDDLRPRAHAPVPGTDSSSRRPSRKEFYRREMVYCVPNRFPELRGALGARQERPFCSHSVTRRTRPRCNPQVEDRDSGIIPAAGGLPGSGFGSKVESFLESAEGAVLGTMHR